MRLPRVYTKEYLTPGSEIDLESGAAHYVSSVLRLSTGDDVILFNGRGGEYSATLGRAKKGKARVHVNHFHDVNRESPIRIHLYQGLSRGDRMDLAIQKATELGVASITPILCQHVQFKGGEQRRKNKMQHWQHIIVNAAQQCRRCELPTLNPVTPLPDALSQTNETTTLFVHPSTQQKLAKNLKDIASIAVFIGPEGGFSEAECQMAVKHKAHVIQLGPRILRTETATVATLSLIQFLFGDI